MSTAEDRTWTVTGGTEEAGNLASAFRIASAAIRLAISRHDVFREFWDEQNERLPGPACPRPDELVAVRRLISFLMFDMASGATLSVTQADKITMLTSLLDLPPETELILREAHDAGC